MSRNGMICLIKREIYYIPILFCLFLCIFANKNSNEYEYYRESQF